MFMHNLHMFQDTQELRDQNKTKSMDKTDCWNVVSVVDRVAVSGLDNNFFLKLNKKYQNMNFHTPLE